MLSTTSVSLLLNLRNPQDKQSWKKFVEIYTPVILNTIRRHQINTADAEDILQEVLLQMSKTIKKYERDPDKGKFRYYLRRVTVNKVQDYWRKRHHRINHLEDPSSIAEENVSDIWENELKRSLLRTALSEVKRASKDLTWICFQEHVLRKRDAESVACEYKTSVNSVYVNSSRIMARVREASLNLKQEHDCEYL